MGAPERGGLRTCLALLAGLSPLLCALPARAEPFQAYGGGLFLGYSFGEQSGGFEWGLEGFATHHLEHHEACSDDSARHGVGPLLRLSFVKFSRAELTLAAHGGGELPNTRSYFDIDGEVGASLFFEGKRRWVAPHTGVTLESLIFNVYLRQEWLGPSLSAGAGARWQPTFGLPGFCEVGRPYRNTQGQRQCAGLLQAHGAPARNPLVQRWAQRASEECASVPSFLQLAVELAELAAPAQLVQRAVQAAREEIAHTELALGLVSSFGGAASVVPPRFATRARLPRRQALRRLVLETWQDGCLNEGLASALAAAEADDSQAPEEARVSRRIALEEAGHAALAFDVLAWAGREAPELVRALGAPLEPPQVAASTSPLRASWLRELATSSARLAGVRLREIQEG